MGSSSQSDRMMATKNETGAAASADTRRVLMISCDTHIGPPLAAYRPYCESKYLAQFDEYDKRVSQAREMFRKSGRGKSASSASVEALLNNAKTKGHVDVGAQAKDMDTVGVAAQVMFHFSQNGTPMPFQPLESEIDESKSPTDDLDARAAGMRMYNRWIADAIAAQPEPERHIGLAYIPFWDIEASIAEIRWAKQVGLRSVNFPTMRVWLPGYNDPMWEPLWAVCEELEMPLTCHGGGGVPAKFTGLGGASLAPLENTSIFHRRVIPWMVFGQVFERHPGLKLVLTELPGTWLRYYIEEMDSVYHSRLLETKDRLPKSPSEYIKSNVFHGASFMSHKEALAAIEGGYTGSVFWGNDYPHVEGAWRWAEDPAEERAFSLASLRKTFGGLPAEVVAKMCGTSAAVVYGVDEAKLRPISERIGYSFEEITNPLTPEETPDPGVSFGFRDGPWH